MNDGLIIDTFAGGGGASTGIEAALGRSVDYAINHDAAAIECHRRNHPGTTHLCESIYKVRPCELVKGRHVRLLWGSPDCTHHSKAKGGKPVSRHRRGLAGTLLWWLDQVRPDVFVMENVEEFQDWGPLLPDGRPDPKRRGQSFRRWEGRVRGLGYQIEARELVAADYGAPTTRRRVFIIARCDGKPIVWPEPTHARHPAAGDLFARAQQPWRTAAECIDWSLPCPSIFERKRPLAENTLKRIAAGLKRYVIEAAEPFIVRFRGNPEGSALDLGAPMPTITAGSCYRPAGAGHALGLCVPTLIQTGYGERAGQAPRVPGLDKPLGTVVAGGGKHALMAAALVGVGARAGQSPPNTPAEPLRTVTAKADRALVTAFLSKFYGTNIGQDLREPMPTITGGGQHIAEVRAFLVSYYGQGVGQSLRAPARTITTKDRLGLVTVAGVDYQISDIGLRMLTPRELAAAQGFPADYWLPDNKSTAVRLIGNSVCPPLAEAIVRANVTKSLMEQVA